MRVLLQIVTVLSLVGCGERTVVEVPIDHPGHPAAAPAAQPPGATAAAVPRASTPDAAPRAPAASPAAAIATAPQPAPAGVADYTCPMHPEISSPTGGRCPKCRMKLEPRSQITSDR